VVSHASGEGLGGFLRIKAVVLEDARQDTYNFEVADTHTYFVGQLNAWVHNACDPGDLLANGGQYLGDDRTTMVGVHGGLFEKLPDGTFENIRPATAEEIALAGVVVRPLDASVGTNSFAAWVPNRTQLIDDLLASGTRITPESVVDIRSINGRTVWLETGNSRAGLQHINDGHAQDFANRGVAQEQIPDLIFNALERGQVVGTAGTGRNLRSIYQVDFNGATQRIGIGISDNGFIVTAHPG
jgi:hypothetical protein